MSIKTDWFKCDRCGDAKMVKTLKDWLNEPCECGGTYYRVYRPD